MIAMANVSLPATTPDVGGAADNAAAGLWQTAGDFAARYWPFIVGAILLSIFLKSRGGR
jgi:hypothetical protein